MSKHVAPPLSPYRQPRSFADASKRSSRPPSRAHGRRAKVTPIGLLGALIIASTIGATLSFTGIDLRSLPGSVSAFSLAGTNNHAAGNNAITARPMPICSSSRRLNCVVDGDTVWLDGEKIRISGIDAPEVHGACPREKTLAAKATRRLSALLDQRGITVRRHGIDRYGRTLADLVDARGDVGERLVAEDLAQTWQGRKAEWCDA